LADHLPSRFSLCRGSPNGLFEERRPARSSRPVIATHCFHEGFAFVGGHQWFGQQGVENDLPNHTTTEQKGFDQRRWKLSKAPFALLQRHERSAVPIAQRFGVPETPGAPLGCGVQIVDTEDHRFCMQAEFMKLGPDGLDTTNEIVGSQMQVNIAALEAQKPQRSVAVTVRASLAALHGGGVHPDPAAVPGADPLFDGAPRGGLLADRRGFPRQPSSGSIRPAARRRARLTRMLFSLKPKSRPAATSAATGIDLFGALESRSRMRRFGVRPTECILRRPADFVKASNGLDEGARGPLRTQERQFPTGGADAPLVVR
jgi:hypothetical protein